MWRCKNLTVGGLCQSPGKVDYVISSITGDCVWLRQMIGFQLMAILSIPLSSLIIEG